MISLHCQMLARLISSLLLFFNICLYPPNWREYPTDSATIFISASIVGMISLIRAYFVYEWRCLILWEGNPLAIGLTRFVWYAKPNDLCYVMTFGLELCFSDSCDWSHQFRGTRLDKWGSRVENHPYNLELNSVFQTVGPSLTAKAFLLQCSLCSIMP